MRDPFGGDDLDRSLTAAGRDQATALATWFAGHPLIAVWSSLAVRCIETVSPLAEAHGLEVVPKRELTEGAASIDLVELLRCEAAKPDDLILCSHGDLIPEVLNRLLREGMAVVGGRGCEKGSIWSLETRGRDIVRGVYTARP